MYGDILIMDPNNAIEAILAIRDTVPEDVLQNFDAELATRLGQVGGTAGTVAVAESIKTPETELEIQLPDFLNPEVSLDISDQLAIMSEFWQTLGYELPKLGAVKKKRLEAVIEAHPDRRVVPTPLLNAHRRKQIGELARINFAKSSFNPNYEAVCMQDISHVYGKLVADPEATVCYRRNDYGLFYQTPDGKLQKRDAYVDALLVAGSAVGVGGVVWTFPVVDTQVNAPRTYQRANKLLSRASPTNSPELQVVIRLLHQANGTANAEWEVDFVNEGVYELDKRGNPIAWIPVIGTGVSWDPYLSQICMSYWYADNRDVGFGVRAEESGL